jgi:HK97 gp10 family phage protein
VFGGGGVKFQFDTAKLTEALDATKDKLRAAARPAAQAGAQVIYDAARINAPVSQDSHFFYIRGKKYGPFAPGTLRDSIYQVYSKAESSDTKATYQVSWNYKKAPYAFMVELGTSRAPAHSFLGKAIREKKKAALDAIKAEYIKEVGKQ